MSDDNKLMDVHLLCNQTCSDLKIDMYEPNGPYFPLELISRYYYHTASKTIAGYETNGPF